MDLKTIANHLYVACCLYEDRLIDPDDHAAVIDAAYLSSDCDDFAWVMSMVTGWPAVTLTWNPGGGKSSGHHSVVKAPDGRLLDISGWTDVNALAARAGVTARSIEESELEHDPLGVSEQEDDEGMEAALNAGRALGRTPFNEAWFSDAVASYKRTWENEPETTVEPPEAPGPR